MSCMIIGNLVEAYVLKNAAREKMKKEAEAANPAGHSAARKSSDAAAAEDKAPEARKVKGGGFLGLTKKVHPKVDRGGASS